MSNKRGGQTAQRKKQAQRPQSGAARAAVVTQTTQSQAATVSVASTAAKPVVSQEAKREARMQRQAVERAAAQRRKRARSLRNFGILGIIAVAVLGGIAAFIYNESNKPGQAVAQQPSTHLTSETSPHAAYVSDPPTSGPHVSNTAPWGVSTTAVAKELMVHNLEDGGVILNYRPDLDKATIDRLAAIATTYGTRVLMAPYPGLSDPLVLTAWGRMDRLKSLDEARVKRFIDAYRGIDHHAQSGT